jgi:hypothetical protein
MNLVWKILDVLLRMMLIKTVACQGELDGLIDRVIREVILNTPENIDTMVPFKKLLKNNLLVGLKMY